MTERAMRNQSGFTLIELLIGVMISGVILGALATAFILTIRGTAGIEQRATESHDAQQVSAYLPADVQSASVESTPPVTPAVDVNPGTSSGCAGTDPGSTNVIRLRWLQDTADDADLHTTQTYYAAYRFDPVTSQLIRVYCVAGASPDSIVVARSLASFAPPQVCGDRVSVSFTETNGYSYTVAASPRAPFGTYAPCPPSVGVLQMLDADADGKVDRVVATFDKALSSGLPCTLGWSLANVPSNGTLTSVSVSGSTATLNIAEGGGPADTSVGSFTVAFSPIAGCNATGFAAMAPADRAAPVILSIASSDGDGKIEPSDTLAITFSEPIAGPSGPTTITEKGASTDTLNIVGVTQGTLSIGNGYVSGSATAVFAGTNSTSGPTITVTVGTCSSGCASVGNGNGSFSFAAATSIADASGNGVAGAFLLSSFKVF